MKALAFRFRLLFVLLAIPILTNDSARAQEKAEDAIRATLQTYSTAWNAADARTIAELYTVDADYTGFGSVMTRGRTEIENRYATLLAGSFSGTEIAIDMSSVRFLKPDVAIVDGSMDLTGLHAADGSPKTAKALFIAIMTNDEGQWKFTTFWSKRM